MKICNLASGSKGNVTYIETKNHKILIDLGMTLKYVTNKLEEINITPGQIDTILITHTHKDHTSAIKTFIKKYNPKIYVTFPMLVEIDYLKEYPNTIIYEDLIELNECIVDSVKLSHDTNDIRGYILEAENKSLAYITDTGYINQKHIDKLSNKNFYLIESNHDIEMLINGPYPEHLKRRVVGPKGHLSNIDASQYIKKMIGINTKELMLMHLSEMNNCETLALENMRKELSNQKICIHCAKQNKISEVIEI